MEIFKRTLVRLSALLVVILIIYFALLGTGYVQPPGSVDAVSKATGKIISADEVDGRFVILLNREIHDKSGTTGDWSAFLEGESPMIMEDIVCSVAKGDASGLEMAESFQSRLPENQMKIKAVSDLMLVSKAERGVFDLIIMSEAAAKSLGASVLYDTDGALVLRI